MKTIYQYKDEPKRQCCPECLEELPTLEMKNGFPHTLNKNIYVTHARCPHCNVEIQIFWV
jgi:C4-type Zn-finger protein